MFHNRWLLAEMSRIAADVILEICHQADVEPGIFTEPPRVSWRVFYL
ncbi:putative transposase [Escherichia coli 2719100]|nr:putative transposase [Escherichia coli 2719100]END86021.1 putative transposase [Escherichia coli P0301867.13]ENG93340.1 putative transposase [Escherichia coli P0301867.3]ENH07193.1 putative transposase [Escherichia coli P0301867.5]